jgi:diguanylate cyclase (GGDEF)-like protein
MAIAATPITHSRSLLDLLQQIVPPQEKAVDLYRRLLAINELSNSMSSATDIMNLQGFLAVYFQEYLPKDSVWFCIRDGAQYRKLRLSGSDSSKNQNGIPLDNGIVGSVIKSGVPLWIPDARPSRKLRKFPEVATETIARSILALPFSVMGKAVGCIEMLSNHPNRFDEIEYHLGLLVAAHLSSTIENVLTRQELAMANARLKDHDQRLTQLNEQLRQLAHTDESTGLFNKRRLFEHLEMEVARAKRYGEIFSCLMLDIDDFKQINDTYGHQAGDEVLRQTGALLRRSLRVTDFVARYGGEEFTVILPRTNSAGAYRVAENLRAAFMSQEFTIPAACIHITLSIGVSSCASYDRLDAQQIIRRADNALYRAKRSGKNQACFADEGDSEYTESGFCQTNATGLTRETIAQ